MTRRFPAVPPDGTDAHGPEPLRFWHAFAGFWGACAAAAAVLLGTAYGVMGRSVWEGIVLAVDDTAGFAVLALAAYACARRFPVTGPRRTRNAVALLACMAAANVLWTSATMAWWALRPWWPMEYGDAAATTGFFWMLVGQVNMFVIPLFACAQGLVLMEMRRVHDVREGALRARLARVELQAVRQQLRPEFLFGVFEAMGERMTRDRDAADAMLSRVAELLRISLRHAAADEVVLQEEWRFTELYLQVECMRLEGRLRYRADIDPRAHRARVPHMVLQPLVENAVLHGAGARSEGGTVEVVARCLPTGELRLEVCDDGPGVAPGAGEAGGLRRAREHLDRLYGAAYTLRLEHREPRGTRVCLTLPQAAPAPPPTPFIGRR